MCQLVSVVIQRLTMFPLNFNSKPCYLLCVAAVLTGMACFLYVSDTFSINLLFRDRELTAFRSSRVQKIDFDNTCNKTELLEDIPETVLVAPENLKYAKPSLLSGRMDVVTVAPWLVPVVWEGTFNAELLNSIYKPLNITIATTVFAVGKYTRFLKDLLETAEQHYFVGYRVNFYIFTDRPQEVPSVKMAAERQVIVLPVPSSNRWQEISARRMEIIQTAIEERLRHNADYIFCLDVDSNFHGHWGVETLGGLVAVVHPGYYFVEREAFPYERRPVSRAYIPADEGDFYYCGGAFGGLLANVHAMAKTCRQRFEEDAAEGVEAAWQEESHLNRYMVSHKPTKLLSPEYLWQDNKRPDNVIRLVRFSAVNKNNDEVRPNQ